MLDFTTFFLAHLGAAVLFADGLKLIGEKVFKDDAEDVEGILPPTPSLTYSMLLLLDAMAKYAYYRIAEDPRVVALYDRVMGLRSEPIALLPYFTEEDE